MRDALARRRALLTAALGFPRLRWRELAPPVAATLTRWLDSWTGLGLVAVGMARQGYRLHLTNIDEGVWRATFSRSAAFAHDGFGAASTPWGAVQGAAWEALTKPESGANG